MPHATAVPTGLLAELRNFDRRNPSLLDGDLPGLRLRQLAGGRNNRAFAWDGPDGEVCLKLYRTDKRDRAGCEYRALAHVAAYGVAAGPQALWHDPDPELPAVAMTMEVGEPVPDLADPTTALRAIVAVLDQLRAIPLGPFADMPHVDSATHCMKRITEVWPGQLDEHHREPLTADMRSLLAAINFRKDGAGRACLTRRGRRMDAHQVGVAKSEEAPLVHRLGRRPGRRRDRRGRRAGVPGHRQRGRGGRAGRPTAAR